MNVDIYKIDKLANNAYQIISPTIKDTFKLISTEIEIVYQYKNLQLVVDKLGNKTCYEIISKEIKNINGFMGHIYQLITLPIVSFPILDRYDNYYERTINKCTFRAIEFMMIKDNETLYFRIKDNVDIGKFLHMIEQVIKS